MDSLTQNRPPNVIVLRSFTKFFAIPGLRLGCAIADPETIRRMRKMIPPWSVNTFAQAVGEAALGDETYAKRTRRFVQGQRESLSKELRAIPGLTVYPSQTNFLLVRIDRSETNASTLAQRLLKEGIAIRVCENFAGLDSRFFRIAVRTAEENQRLCESLRAALGGRRRPMGRRRTSAIMFQGTCSNAGKSVLAAALCRILLQDGYRVTHGKTELIGICGGFQILGNKIADPHGLESKGQSLRGLGLLPVSTTLAREKTLRCVRAKHRESGFMVKGYEIHHGQTEGMNFKPCLTREDGKVIGVGSNDGRLWGTYLHGIFDTDEFRRWFIDRLRNRCGLPPIGNVCVTYDLEPAFNRLADVVRRGLRVDEIYHLMGLR